MPGRNAKDLWGHRLPLYAYVEPLFIGRRVLEIGCGTGAGVQYLITHGADRVVGVDVDPAAIEQAGARIRRPGLDLRVVPGMTELPALGETFDLIVVPEADTAIRRPGAVAAWKRLLADGGRLVVSVASGDRGRGGAAAIEGIGYYELADALAAQFPRVRMFGQTPFLGFGMIEFEGAPQELHVDSRLIDGGAEPAARYLAVGCADEVLGLGYALVQVPFAPLEMAALAGRENLAPRLPAPEAPSANERRLEESERRTRTRLEEAEGRVSELRRRVDDATAQSDSAIRITRAQGEEIEELRGRLRRAAEDRAGLDGEISKLRRALADADELVLSLTRRTAEEMAVVAQRLRVTPPVEPEVSRGQLAEYAALRDEADQLRAALAETEARASAAEQRLEAVAATERERKEDTEDLRVRLRRAEEGMARERREIDVLQERLRLADAETRRLEERQEVLSARDERIAVLEGEKQDLTWRLAELEEKLRQAIGRVVSGEAARAHSDELISARASRERALEEFHKAAGAHVDELTRFKTSVSEQTALVNELEESLKAAETKAAAAINEAAALRKAAKELEEADRTRRSRLAELEGKLLRLEHERRQAAAAAPEATSVTSADREPELADLRRQRDGLRDELEGARRAAADDRAARDQARADSAQAQARAGQLEDDLTRLKLLQQTQAGNPPPSIEPPHRAQDGISPPPDPRIADELRAIEDELRVELRTLTSMETTLQAEIGRQPAEGPSDTAGRPHVLFGNGSTVLDDGLKDQNAEVILLHSTLTSFRRRASRLRDEIEGLRRRIESLSLSEISGFLEELGEDLAEFGE